MTVLRAAIELAREIRRDLLATPADYVSEGLAGACGIAAIELAIQLRRPNSLRLGFFMKRERFMGHLGYYPNQHAWSVVDDHIIDVTATQFGRFPAIHVVPIGHPRYVETANGLQAAGEIRKWDYPEWPALERCLRRLGRRQH